VPRITSPARPRSRSNRQVVALRQQLPTFGARRLIREFDLPLSHRALERIWRQHGFVAQTATQISTQTRPRPHPGHLAHLSADLRRHQGPHDIPRYWPQAQALHLPAVQYTARDVRSGLLFWAFAQRRSAAASSVFAARIQQHLQRCGVSLRDLVWQTDNGSEFLGSFDRQGRCTGFPAALGDSQHVRIPPAAHTFQSDVETVHRLVEDEFFDLESFSDRSAFLAKAFTYQLYFNLVRPNSHKQHLSPWQIVQQLQPRSPLQLCLLPPVFLDDYLNDSGGYDLPRHP
jgi:hypothetical protein